MSFMHTAAHALLAALCATGAVWAQTATTPPGFVASPEVYKVIAENDRYRVIEVVWKSGQKDQPHSHPDASVYYVTNCRLRSEAAGSAPQEFSRLAGGAYVQRPIASHTVENIGSTDCRLIMFEPK